MALPLFLIRELFLWLRWVSFACWGATTSRMLHDGLLKYETSMG
jgi:hypothetical protein